jgi:hypothetical protein
LEQFRYKLQQWADGSRFISLKNSIPYQINLLKRTDHSIDAIHVGLSEESLLLWTRPHGAFSRLVEAHRDLDESIHKRRIFVFDDKLLNAERKIEDSRVLDVCKRQIGQPSEGGLGVELRILWRSTVDRTQSPIPPDLLIADGTEAIVITGTGGDYMEVKALVNQTQVRTYISFFERHWEISEPIRYYLA